MAAMSVPEHGRERPQAHSPCPHTPLALGGQLSPPLPSPPPLPSLRPPQPPGGSGWRRSGPVCPCTTGKHTRRPTTLPPHDVHHPRRRLTPPHLHRYSRLAVGAGSSPPSQAIGGGREGGIFLSGSSGWCWSAKQWGVEPRARQDLHLAWWGGREGRGGVGMKGVASCTPTLQGQGRYRHGGKEEGQLGREGGEVVGH